MSETEVKLFLFFFLKYFENDTASLDMFSSWGNITRELSDGRTDGWKDGGDIDHVG